MLPTLGQINDMKASTRNVLGVEVSPFGNKNVTTRTLNKISDFIGWALNDLEDMPFFKIAYERSLMNYMKAQSLTEVTPEARVYATEFALEATYKNGGVVIELIEGAKKTKKHRGKRICRYYLHLSHEHL